MDCSRIPPFDTPGSLFIRVRAMSSCGCRSITSLLATRSSLAALPKIECGTGLNWMTIWVRFSGIRLPVRRKKGTPAQRQLSMSARSATKVSVPDFWPRSCS